MESAASVVGRSRAGRPDRDRTRERPRPGLGSMSQTFKDRVVELMPMLRGYAMTLTRSSSEADDLVQDTLVRAWRYREGFQPGTNLEAWLCAIQRNCFYTSRAGATRTVQ